MGREGNVEESFFVSVATACCCEPVSCLRSQVRLQVRRTEAEEPIESEHSALAALKRENLSWDT